jgi:hypothetical protein
VQGPLLSRPLRVEESDLSTTCVSSEERETVRALDLVHAGDLRDHCLERHTLVDPEGHVVEGVSIHAKRDTRYRARPTVLGWSATRRLTRSGAWSRVGSAVMATSASELRFPCPEYWLAPAAGQ